VTSNRSVDSDTLRQGAAQCRGKSCTVRPLAATCRSLHVRPHVSALAFDLLALGPVLALVAGVFASFVSGWRRANRKTWQLCALVGVPATISAFGALATRRESGEVDTRIAVALVAMLVCAGLFAFAFAAGGLLRSIWHSVQSKRNGGAV
jgi:hypothetical protein